ncbi:GmrSD restriction endonuclease domain-containing protein [Micromonospora sp. DT228]|uniref:GmrSD restriction endonuclease domain-containing protein n=1 Tax=Micromonospora sp. DT228 TaxID=3393443 RepID=UPI003CF91435
MPFESPDWPLADLLRDIRAGKVQLPDFQRDWKWDDPRIASLLATITRGYPIGVVMTLETGGDGARFKPKPLAGVQTQGLVEPEQLLLDGQQRLTSLFQSLMSGKPVDTTDPRGKRLKRWYYINIEQALGDEGDREDAIIGVPEDKQIRDDFGRKIVADFSTMEQECEAGMFPLRLAFDEHGKVDWLLQYIGTDPVRRARWQQFQTVVLQNLSTYLVPMIKLTRSTPKEAVCTVFEKVNTGGVPLNVFELLTATYAGDQNYFAEHGADFRLNDYWVEVQHRLSSYRVLRNLENTDFLQAVTLLATYERKRIHTGDPRQAPGVSCKRRDILRLRLSEFLAWAPRVTEALEWAAAFLAQEHIFDARDIPYRTQLVPLAAVRAAAGDDASLLGNDAKLRQWFWCGVLGELYGGTTETRFARDLEQVLAWLAGGKEPITVAEAAFHEERLYTLRTRNSAAYKGIYALLMRQGGRDWMKSEALNMASFYNYKVDIHHIFPKAWCDRNRIDPVDRESIVNKTALSRQTNIRIGGQSPATYLPKIEKAAQITSAQLDAVLQSHAIDPKHLRAADFEAFFDARTEALLELVEGAMGKRAVRSDETSGVGDESPEAFDLEPEEPEDDLVLVESRHA